jgi:hypothetical protein
VEAYFSLNLALCHGHVRERIPKAVSLHINAQKAVDAIRPIFPHNITRRYKSVRLMILQLLPSTAENRSSEINKPIPNIYRLQSGCNLHAIWHLYPKRHIDSLLHISSFVFLSVSSSQSKTALFSYQQFLVNMSCTHNMAHDVGGLCNDIISTQKIWAD